jgi:hypothetical protein
LNVETFFASSLVSVPEEIRPHSACTKATACAGGRPTPDAAAPPPA